ncbi:MAG: response regulator [Candidatus Promineifilaceae bacterium]
MRVLIAVRQETMRRALKTLLDTRPGLEVVGEAANKKELISQVESARPHLLLLDEDLSDEPMADLIAALQQVDPPPMVMVLGGRSESGEAYLETGAVAFVNSSDPPKSLLTAIEEIRFRSNRV